MRLGNLGVNNGVNKIFFQDQDEDQDSVADPEVLSRGGELRVTKAVKSGEGPCPLPRNFFEF